MQTGFARSWAFERIAADSGLQIRQVSEYVRLATQFVGNHWRLARNRRDHGDANTASLHGFDQRAKISVAGEKHDVIDAVGKFHRVDCKLDVHVPLTLLWPLASINSLVGLVTTVKPFYSRHPNNDRTAQNPSP